MSDSPGPSEPPPSEPAPGLQRLDPDRGRTGAGDAEPPAARADAPGSAPGRDADLRRPVIETRRYGAVVGVIGLVLVAVFSIFQIAGHGLGTTGVAPGGRLHVFAAPLAASSLDGDPTADPTCSLAHHDPRALNVCLLVARGPLALAFFVTGAPECVRQIDALQTLSRRYPGVQFAAVAVNGGHRATARLVARHHWTIPVAYDRDGRVGSLYGVAACPMVELAQRDGIVADRLIGDRWQTTAALDPRVRALANGWSGG